MNTLTTRLAAAATAVTIAGSAAAQTVVIGQFGNPTPMQVARAKGAFDAATGWDIEWRTFASGAEVIAAMASSDIKLAELGSSPLAIAASQGVELQLFMIAQVIGEAESLIVREGSEIAAPQLFLQCEHRPGVDLAPEIFVIQLSTPVSA